VALCLINEKNTGNYHHILRLALAIDFPFFEPHCKLSPLTLCKHPHSPCKRAKLSLVGYAKFTNGTYKFEPLPFDPEPIHTFVCKGCRVQKGKCKEECTLYAKEIIGYRVYQWDTTLREFKYLSVTKESLEPLKHGFFCGER
jgi:hypothetical protein